MRYVALHWVPGDGRAEAAAGHVRAQRPRDWQVLADQTGFFAACWFRPGSRGTAEALATGGVVVGRVFDRAATDAGHVAPPPREIFAAHDVDDLARRLLTRCWGAYVAIVPAGSSLAVVRDPMGALDCLTWRTHGVRIVASRLEPFVDTVLPAGRGVDRAVVAGLVTTPVAASEALALRQVSAVPPGSLCRASGARLETRRLWSPLGVCRARPPVTGTPERLAVLVDACVAAWASCFDTIVAELSGGLDSAIVASALRAAGAPVALWINHFAVDPQADERAFARATAAHLALPLLEIERSPAALTASDLDRLSAGARPGMPGMDVHHDRDIAEQAAMHAAAAIFTGQGGDAVFFQMPTALVAADHLPGGPRRFAAAALDAARWTRTTVWASARDALRGRRSLARLARAPAPFVTEAPPPDQPWCHGTGHLAPAKQLQIWGLANSRVYFVESVRSAASDMVHPLLSQPLVEHTLALSATQLTGGVRDRRLARDAFAARLPALVTGRHGKGDVTAYYGRLVAASASFLEQHLGHGWLAAAGIIDRDRVAALLDLDTLALEDWYTEMLSAALVESWLRQQQGAVPAGIVASSHATTRA